jgi:Ca-activated chloride channel family protein
MRNAARSLLPTRSVPTVLSVLLAVAVLDGQRTPFRSSVDLVTLNVTVTGEGGKYIGGLTAEDFTIVEEGKPQTLSLFERENSPLAVSLLIDSSGSMMNELGQAQQAAADFIARLRSDDVAQVVDFDRRIQVLQAFTSDRRELETALRRMTARGSTSMYNAVYIALRELGALASPPAGQLRRDVIVVLSDGEDTSSLVTFDHLLDAAKRSQTVIYAIGLGLGGAPVRRGAVPPEVALRTLARDTGGRLFLARDGRGLAGVYNAIAEELASQYVLGYSSNIADRPGWRRVAVGVVTPGAQARTRPGYYAATGKR